MDPVLLRPFDIETHKAHFINYLEVIITESGQVQYAVPSHQEKLVQICCERLGITRQALFEMCPIEQYSIGWLCEKAHAVAVWDAGIRGKCNRLQHHTLNRLKAAGLYHGQMPGLSEEADG